MHLVLQLLHLQANLKITCQMDVTLTVVHTIATIQEMTILETACLQAALMIAYQSIAALVKILSKQKKGLLYIIDNLVLIAVKIVLHPKIDD
jgi:hypothetical protein